MIPNEHAGAFAWGRKVGREPRQQQAGDRTDRTPTDKAPAQLRQLGEVEPITRQSFRLWGLGGDLLVDEGSGSRLTPGRPLRLRLPTPPDFLLEAQRNIGMLRG